MSRKLTCLLQISAACLLLAGCAAFSPSHDPSKFYTLVPLTDVGSARTTNKGMAQVSLIVGPIKFPGYLDRQQIASRISPNQLEFSETHRWAEPLPENFARILSENLSALLGTEKISLFPRRETTTPDYQLEIDVSRFEVNSDREAYLRARWAIRNGKTRKVLKIRESRLKKTSSSRSAPSRSLPRP